MARRKTRVQRKADEVLGRFYRLRILTPYDEVATIDPRLPAVLHSVEGTIARVRGA